MRVVDGKSRDDGIRGFLGDRGMALREGTGGAPPDACTVQGVGVRVHDLVLQRLETKGVELYGVAKSLLGQLHERGGKIAVVSVDEDSDALLEAAGISELFDARIGGSASNGHHLSGKAVLNVYLQWAETLGVDPRGTVLVENAVTEIRAARAGRFGRVVRVGQRDELGSHEAVDILRSDGADVVVDLWVLTTRPSSSGRHPVFVDDAAQTVGSS